MRHTLELTSNELCVLLDGLQELTHWKGYTTKQRACFAAILTKLRLDDQHDSEERPTPTPSARLALKDYLVHLLTKNPGITLNRLLTTLTEQPEKRPYIDTRLVGKPCNWPEKQWLSYATCMEDEFVDLVIVRGQLGDPKEWTIRLKTTVLKKGKKKDQLPHPDIPPLGVEVVPMLDELLRESDSNT